MDSSSTTVSSPSKAPHTGHNTQEATYETVLASYFRELLTNDPDASAKLDWRMQCYAAGKTLAHYIESEHFSLKNRTVIDSACAWGGHAYAFAEKGALVIGSDLLDHEYAGFAKKNHEKKIAVHLAIADCMKLPYRSESGDLILGLELIEHIPSLIPFAEEIARVLRPGGIAILSTPPRLRSLWEGEPHYHLRGLALLPFHLQGLVARKIFSRDYPYPITCQYTRARSALTPFTNCGLVGSSLVFGANKVLAEFHPCIAKLIHEFHWNYLLVKKNT